MSDPHQKKAVVLVSGGLDSATTLAIARLQDFACHAISFNYGQRHMVELDSARAVVQSLGGREHVVTNVDLRAFGGSALTAEIAVPKDRTLTSREAHGLQSVGFTDRSQSDIPITYVPARNTIFLSLALGYAEVLDCTDIFIGVNAIDYSGYPDCRPAFIRAFENMANLATRIGVEGHQVCIHTPLIDMTKAQIIQRGVELGVDFAMTFSCYDPDPRTSRPCGHCDSCLLRAAGFREAGIQDPGFRSFE